MLRMKYFKSLNQAGDTIIEVLIAMAVLAIVLSGAYYVANHSLSVERDSQEHSEASTIAQSQIEALRTAYELYPGNFLPASDNCYDGNGNPSNNCYVGPGTLTYVASCVSSPTFNVPYCYQVHDFQLSATTFRAPGCTGPNCNITEYTYDAQVTWPRIGGGNNEVDMYYRIN